MYFFISISNSWYYIIDWARPVNATKCTDIRQADRLIDYIKRRSIFRIIHLCRFFFRKKICGNNLIQQRDDTDPGPFGHVSTVRISSINFHVSLRFASVGTGNYRYGNWVLFYLRKKKIVQSVSVLIFIKWNTIMESLPAFEVIFGLFARLISFESNIRMFFQPQGNWFCISIKIDCDNNIYFSFRDSTARHCVRGRLCPRAVLLTHNVKWAAHSRKYTTFVPTFIS